MNPPWESDCRINRKIGQVKLLLVRPKAFGGQGAT